MLALIFLSHDWEDHRVGVGRPKWVLCVIYFLAFNIETLPLLSVQLSQHLLEMLSSVQTFGQRS